jgi:hypothetical protein
MINLITLIGNKCNSNKKENISKKKISLLKEKIFEKKIRKTLCINAVHIYRLSQFNILIGN